MTEEEKLRRLYKDMSIEERKILVDMFRIQEETTRPGFFNDEERVKELRQHAYDLETALRNGRLGKHFPKKRIINGDW